MIFFDLLHIIVFWPLHIKVWSLQLKSRLPDLFVEAKWMFRIWILIFRGHKYQTLLKNDSKLPKYVSLVFQCFFSFLDLYMIFCMFPSLHFQFFPIRPVVWFLLTVFNVTVNVAPARLQTWSECESKCGIGMTTNVAFIYFQTRSNLVKYSENLECPAFVW